MPNDTTTVATFWHGDPLSNFERLSLTSFVDAGYRVALYSYIELEVPAGVELRDARSVLPTESLFDNPAVPGSFALFANWFRYQLLNNTTYTWVDTDVVLLDRQIPDLPYIFGWEDERFINSEVLRLPADSPLLRSLLTAARELEYPEARQVKWGTFGPKLLTRAVHEHELVGYALPVPALYPINYADVWRLFDPKSLGWCRSTVEGAVALHMWNAMFSKLGIKSKVPPKGSYIRELMTLHEIEPRGKKMSARWVREVWGRQGARQRSGFHRHARSVVQIAARPNHLLRAWLTRSSQ